MKRLLSSFVILLLWITPLSAQWNGTATPWIQGGGTENNPYIISNAEHLAYLANQVNSGTDYAGQHFLLTNNISLSQHNWTPIGTSSHRFKGVFDGGGHTIDSLYINYSSNSNIGLFGYAENGTICNLRCKGTIQSNEGNYSIGGIVGRISNNNIYSCYSEVDIDYYDGDDVGGIVGNASSSTITRCHVRGDVGGIHAGGIVGFVYSATISDCIVESEASVTGYQDVFNSNPTVYKGVAGGVVGTANTITIVNCKNFAEIGASHVAGGFIGICNYYATVSECGNYGGVYVYEYDNLDKYAAGIVGKMEGGLITQCFNQGEILIEAIDDQLYSEHAYAAGIVATMGASDGLGVISYCYNSGNIIIDYCQDCWDEYINAGLEYATGISPYFSNYCTTNYCYNVGNITVLLGNNKYGVGPTSTLTNCYYRNGCGATTGGTAMNSSQMQSSNFLSLLNVGESPFSPDAGNTNSGYPVLHFSNRPIVTTDAADNITSYTATLNGHFFGVADSIGFVYKPASGALDYSRVVLGAVSNPAIFNIDSLLPESYYLFSFFAYWEGDLIHGDTILFCTKPMYNIVVGSNNDNWGAASGSGTFAYGETATLVATPTPPYVFSQWSDDNTNNPRNVIVTYNAQYMAIFSLPQYTLTLYTNNPAWGGTSGSGQYQYGDSAFCVAVPANGYHFVMWDDSITTESRFVSIYGDTSLTAIFAPNQYTVTVVSNDTTKGHVYGGGTVDYNSTVQIFAVAIGDNNFLYWSDGNPELIRTVTVTQNITYMAIFTGVMYHISGVANQSAYGLVTGSGDYPQDSVAILEAIPNYGYEFAHWLDNDTNNPRSVVANSNATYTAVFIPKVFHVNVESSNIAMGSVSGSGNYQFNTQAVIQANHNPHNSFSHWNDGETLNPRTITVVSDTSFTAFFEAEPTYTVTIVSEDSTKGYVIGGGTFYRGEQVNFSAIPYPHYRFLQWNDGVFNAERTETVISDITYIAKFAGVICTVNAYPNDATLGTVAGSGDYEYNNSVTITATPADGCTFVQWDNGVNSATFTFTVQRDESFVAIFSRNNSIDSDVNSCHPTMIVEKNRVKLLNASNRHVAIYDAIGRQHYYARKYDGRTIYLHPSGVYFVVVDTVNLGKVLIIE